MSSQKLSLTRRSCYVGYLTQAIAINLSPLLFLTFERSFGISLSLISLLIGINFGIRWLTDLVSARFLGRVRSRALLVAAHLSVTLGLVGFATFPYLFPVPFWGLALATLLCGCGAGLIEVLTNPLMAAISEGSSTAGLCLLHSFYCWGYAGTVALSVLYFALFGIARWQGLAVLAALVPLLGAFLFLFAPLPHITSQHSGATVWQLFFNKRFLLLAAMVALSGAVEMIMSQWASSFAEAALGVSKLLGDLLGPLLFALLMGSARVFGSLIKSRARLLTLISGSAILLSLSYLLAAALPLPLPALLACGLCGLAVGLLWPAVYSIADDALPHGGVPLFAMLALAGDLGCLLGPSAAGVVASLRGGDLRFAFLLAALLPLLFLLCLFALGRISADRSN